MKAAAYAHGPQRVVEMAKAFQQGCLKHHIPCELRHVRSLSGKPVDFVWLYGMGEGAKVFHTYPKAIRLVGDRGYFHGYKPTAKRPDVHLRVSINAQQPDAHLRLRRHPLDRFNKLGITVEPVTKRGDYILLCGMGPKQASFGCKQYGQWERETYAKLRTMTDRPIYFREKPKNPPLDLPKCPHKDAAESIRNAYTVVCNTGNIGADCILHGVPVVANAGPGRVYYPIADLDAEPLTELQRWDALADLSYWHWTYRELASGEFLAHLRAEGVL